MTFMSSEISELDDQQKELCAILVMRTCSKIIAKIPESAMRRLFTDL